MTPNLPDNWIKYFELQDEWAINQSKLYNGDLRDMESSQCKNCIGGGGCLWCIVKAHASSGIRIPLLTGDRNWEKDSADEYESISSSDDTPSVYNSEERVPSLSEETRDPDNNQSSPDEDSESLDEENCSFEEDSSSGSQAESSELDMDRNNFDLFILQQSSKRGCETCGKLLQYLLPFLDLWPNRVDDGSICWHKGELQWRIEETVGEENGSWSRFHERTFSIFYPSRNEIKEKVHPMEKCLLNLPRQTWSLSCFDKLLAWCQTCTENHSRCGVQSDTVLPNRVLYIKYGLEGLHVKLVEGTGKVGRYICLSHCWGILGATQPLRLTKKNKPLFEKELPLLSMPQTFRDVLPLVRRLGISYLWIDSLCILQDDNYDWHREAAAMSSVYQNSWLTIAATASSNSNEGLYRVLDKYHYSARLKELRSIRLNLEHPFDGKPWETKTFPLLSRGWAFQERLLPPRVVHFTQHELIFECREGFWCECGIYKTHGCNQTTPKLSYNQMITKVGLENSERWHDIVSEYSRLDLSFYKDRLPAISGIAKHLQSTSRQELGKYLAGLWEGSLEFDLLWYSSHLRLLDRPQPKSAPSWSWAATKGRIGYEKSTSLYRSGQHAMKVLGHNISPLGPDTFGELRFGHLIISGFVARGWITYYFNDEIAWTEVNIQGISPRIMFTSDYNLRTPGEAFVQPGEISFLMTGIDVGAASREDRFSLFLGLRYIDPTLNHFERIGIGYAPKRLFDEDWTKAWAEERVITLV